MANKILVFKARFDYFKNNKLGFSDKIKQGFRFSLWKDNSNFTAGEIVKIFDHQFLIPGSSYDLRIKLINSEVSTGLKPKDKVSIGVPYDEIGTIEILERLQDIML